MDTPRIIILISGKRKSGKDFISETLLKILGDDKCAIIRISEPIKTFYAKEKNLNLVELMSDNVYKEHYRLEMINWSDEIRTQDPGYFCKAACGKAPRKPVWIVSDIRRKTDIKWFRNTYQKKIRIVRISADTEVRQNRGFVFTKGVDDVASECDLDDFNEWDLNIKNNSNEDLDLAVKKLVELIEN
ncbi:hypothetical protein ILUMI_04076 [Ignelater luminosus]|uniref:Phosphomevalonate kinase n=1 Tax=Ignelater luminosus TaxID=2038154 RepID=A0A8K0GLJ3_IGNLU|nr:hypothetical protein ILUMI_04076 [Ignelater luminosus]